MTRERPRVVYVQRAFTPGAAADAPRGGTQELLRERGYEVRTAVSAPTRTGSDPGRDVGVDADEVVLLFGNPRWQRPLVERLAALKAGGAGSPAILWHCEPLPLPRGAPFPRPRLWSRELLEIARRSPGVTDPYSNAWTLLRLARRGVFDAIAVSTPSAQRFLAERGVDSELAPLGWWPDYGRPLGLERDVDVLFLGEAVPRRTRILRRLAREGVEVASVGGWDETSGAWGDERTRLLNRTRILLNLPRQPGLLSGMRLQLGMANGALVASEPIFDARPYREGEHFVAAPPDELPRLLRHYLEHEDERAAIAERAYRFVTEEVTLAASVDRIAALIERVSARRGSGSSR